MTKSASQWTHEHKKIRSRDWRIHAITTLEKPYSSPSGRTFEAGSEVCAVGFLRRHRHTYDIALPSPVALYLGHAAEQELRARRCLARVFATEREPDETDPLLRRAREATLFDALQRRSAAVIFSYTAIEAFANESLPRGLAYRRVDRRLRETRVLRIEEVERYVPLSEKLHAILPEVFGVSSMKGLTGWREFAWLAELRDQLVHLKHGHWRGLHPPHAPTWIWSRIIEDRAQLAPWVARDVIAHYRTKDEPRWLFKFSRRYRRHFAV